MSNNFVTLVLKSVIDESQLLEFQNFASLVLEHYSSNSGLSGRTQDSPPKGDKPASSEENNIFNNFLSVIFEQFLHYFRFTEL